MLSPRQSVFVDKSIKHPKVRQCISSPREYEFMNYLDYIGFRLNVDYVHQFVCSQEEMGLVAVADFCFPNEKLVIELDGKTHNHKDQKNADERRDKTFIANNYMVIRIKVPMSNYDYTYFQYIIKDLYEERHEAYQSGRMVKGGRVCKDYREEQTASIS
jgi:very-short-patch-repair endonuclease